MARGFPLRGLFLVGLMICGQGCATTKARELPHRRWLAGGGFIIDFRAPVAGTAIWGDEGTGRVLQTQSLDAGESFSINADPSDEEVQQMFGDVTKARPVLYFVPQRESAP